MRVAVTGGSGQLGSVVLRRLIDHRKVKRIVSLDLAPPRLVSGKLEARQVDVRDPGLAFHLEGCEVVFHLAFLVTAKVEPEAYYGVNVEGTRNLFQAAAQAGARQVIYASSMAAYGVFGDHPDPIVETTPRRPLPDFPYSYAKYQVEEWLDQFEPAHPELAVVRLRPAILVGTRFGNPLGELFGQALSRGWLVSSNDVPLPLVWDEDVADAAIAAMDQGRRGAYNLMATPEGGPAELAAATGLKDVRTPKVLLALSSAAAPLLEKLGLGDPVDPSWARFGGVRMVLSSEKAKQELNWRPRCPTNADVLRRYRAEAPGAGSQKLSWFFRSLDLATRGKAEPELSGMSSAVHLCLLGPGGGDYTLRVQDGRLSAEPGAPRPPTSVATMKLEVFQQLLRGELDFASAQLTGKLRLEGDTSAGFVVGALVRRFRNQTELPGWRGQAARRFASWLAGGVA